MNALIKSARIIDKQSEFNNTTNDILVEDGVIKKIAPSLKNVKNYSLIKFENLHVSQGWFDSSVSFGEPGFENRETIENGLYTAARSGFSSVALQPNSFPVVDNKSLVSYIKSQANDCPTKLFPVGALTKNSKGTHLAEIFDMQNAGGKAFGDYKKAIKNPNILKTGLLYANSFNGLIMSYPEDFYISQFGVMNENISSTKLGLKGNPELSEILQISRDLEILEYTNGKLHIPTISTSKSVNLIKSAKSKGLDVSCSVAIHNLIFKDSDIANYNTNFKVRPPLRTQNAVDSLIDGLKDGTIDMVTTDHNPISDEEKQVEFDHASFGTIGLECAFGALNSIFSTKKTIDLLTKGKERFGLSNNPIKVGNICDITLFNPKKIYKFQVENILSKSKNCIYLNSELKGKVFGIMANKKIELNY